MRWTGPILVLYGVALLAAPRSAVARPEFARREGLACAYCHIQPRGGGPRNSNGLRYARHEFQFPPEKGTLNSFEDEREREQMVRARKLLRLNHVEEAFLTLVKLEKKLDDGPAKNLVKAELHALEVRGDEILGEARLLLRKRKPKERAAGVEMLLMLANEFDGLPARDKARDDLKELERDKELKEVLDREEEEQKARAMLLDALAFQVDGKAKRAAKELEKLTKKYPLSRAAEQAAQMAGSKEPGDEKPPAGSAAGKKPAR